jgi:hypothetical protein
LDSPPEADRLGGAARKEVALEAERLLDFLAPDARSRQLTLLP